MTPPSSAPPASAPSGAAPSDSTPSDSTPSDSTPSDSTPSDSTPSDSTRSDSTPHGDADRLHPPARRVVRAAVTDAVLDVAEHEREVADRSAGAVVSFAGVVRDHDHGRAVTELEYVAHPGAGGVLDRLVRDLAAELKIEAVAVSHRVGPLKIGDAALVVAVSAAHRQEAFAAAARLVDEVKLRVPIWKRQVFDDGTDEWVACP